MRSFQVILATDTQGTLAVDGELPWNCPDDMKYFRSVTSYTPIPGGKNILICGRRTWDSMGRRTLPGRRLFVISKQIQ
jgi:dihydrofolate reductase